MLKILLFIVFSLFFVNSFFNKRLINKSVLKEKNVIILNMNSCNNSTLLNNQGLPQFSKFDSKQVENDVNQILNNLKNDFSELEKRIEKEADVSNLYNLVIEEMERIEYPLEFGWGIVSHLHSVKNNNELREVYQKMQPQVIKLSNEISQSEILFNGLKRLSESNILNEERQRIVDLTKNSMFLSGIGLGDEERKNLMKIH